MEPLKLFLAAFAVYRIAILITEDSGPLSVFANLRAWADEKALNGQLINFNEGVHCPYCVGVWAAIACALLLKFPTWPGDLFLLAFGLAGVQAALQRMIP
jgi:hypothetical protein